MKYIDPDGKDWFVNNENGNLTYLKGIEDLSKLNQDQLDKYKMGDVNQYERLGADNMFGDKIMQTANNQPNLKNTYAYNIRSWTNSITSTHFIEKLTYNLNGNIATQNWLQANTNHTYTFAYDNLSRIKSATYTNTAFPLEKFAENMT